MTKTRVSEDTVYHTDVVGQANSWFAHRLDWARHCTICAGQRLLVHHPSCISTQNGWYHTGDCVSGCGPYPTRPPSGYPIVFNVDA